MKRVIRIAALNLAVLALRLLGGNVAGLAEVLLKVEADRLRSGSTGN